MQRCARVKVRGANVIKGITIDLGLSKYDSERIIMPTSTLEGGQVDLNLFNMKHWMCASPLSEPEWDYDSQQIERAFRVQSSLGSRTLAQNVTCSTRPEIPNTFTNVFQFLLHQFFKWLLGRGMVAIRPEISITLKAVFMLFSIVFF